MNTLDTLDTASTTAIADPVTHPAWCDPTRCTVEPDLPLDDALHLSRTVETDAAVSTAGPIGVDAWLHQSAGGGEVYLVVDVPGTRGRAMFALTAATAAADALTQLIEQGHHRRDDLS